MGNSGKDYPLKNERKWCQISMEATRPSVNPLLPEMLITAVVAQRSDGLWVRVEGNMPVSRLQVIPTGQAGVVEGLKMAAHLLINLEGYRNCECAETKPCVKHGGGLPS